MTLEQIQIEQSLPTLSREAYETFWGIKSPGTVAIVGERYILRHWGFPNGCGEVMMKGMGWDGVKIRKPTAIEMHAIRHLPTDFPEVEIVGGGAWEDAEGETVHCVIARRVRG